MLKEVAYGIFFATPLGLADLVGLLWLIREVVRWIRRAGSEKKKREENHP